MHATLHAQPAPIQRLFRVLSGKREPCRDLRSGKQQNTERASRGAWLSRSRPTRRPPLGADQRETAQRWAWAPFQAPPFPLDGKGSCGRARSGQGRAGVPARSAGRARRSEPWTARTVPEHGGRGKGGARVSGGASPLAGCAAAPRRLRPRPLPTQNPEYPIQLPEGPPLRSASLRRSVDSWTAIRRQDSDLLI